MIYLLNAHQGLAYKLMNSTMQKLEDCPTVALWVLKGNDISVMDSNLTER